MPDMKLHNEVEKKVCKHLESLGFVSVSMTYHEILPQEIQEALKRNPSPTALYIRTRADRVAFHLDQSVVFEWEYKSHESSRYKDITLEALPLMHHIKKAELGVRILYIHYDKEKIQSFWVDHMPAIRELWIPRVEKNDGIRSALLSCHQRYFPDAKVVAREAAGGSNDPFVIIDSSVKDTLPTARELISELLDKAGQG